MSDGQDPGGTPLANASSTPPATPAPPATATPAAAPVPAGRWVVPPRRLLWWEIIAVFAVSLGGSGLYAFVDLIGSLTATKSLGKQTATLNGSLSPGRPTLDLFLQLTTPLLRGGPGVPALDLLPREAEWPPATA